MAAAQLAFDMPPRNWGGKRAGAGRPRKNARPELNGRPGIPHLARERVPSYLPVHVTVKVRNGVGNLRGYERALLIEKALHAAKERFGMRIVHWSIQGNHVHLIVEADSRAALARGMKGFSIRVARGLNALNRRHGAVFVDRYHSAVLRSPRQVRNTIRYVERNGPLHAGLDPAETIDPLSSDARRSLPGAWILQVEPRTWLLTTGWRRRAQVTDASRPRAR